MFAKAPLPFVRFKRLPPLFCLSFGAFLGVVLTAFVLQARSSQKHEELMANYGNALAGLVAKDAIDPMMARDLLSLHAVILDVVALPRVRLAVVYDVDRELVAQAGSPPHESDVRLFSAAISPHGRVEGHIVVTLADDFLGDRTLLWTLLSTSILLLLMSCLSLFESRSDVFVRSRPVRLSGDDEGSSNPLSSAVSDELFEGGAVEGSSVKELTIEAGRRRELSCSDLIISLPNYCDLERQLSDIVFSRRVALFELGVKKIADLYGGFQLGATGVSGVYCFRFESELGQSEAVFSAVCAALLVRSVEQEQKIKFQLLVEVCSMVEDVRLEQSVPGIFLQGGLLDALLLGRLLVQESEGGRACVVGLQEPFASALGERASEI